MSISISIDTEEDSSQPTLEILHKKLWQLAKVEADLMELREFVSYTNRSIGEYKLKEQKYKEEISYLTQTNEILKKQLESPDPSQR